MGNDKLIVIADDDDDDFAFFHEAFNELNHQAKLIRACDGRELFYLLNNHYKSPDLLFLDVNMPGKNGIDCLVEIRKHKIHKQLPVVIFSTSSADHIITAAHTEGAHGYIIKPNDFENWKYLIHKALVNDWKNHQHPSSLESFVLNSII